MLIDLAATVEPVLYQNHPNDQIQQNDQNKVDEMARRKGQSDREERPEVAEPQISKNTRDAVATGRPGDSGRSITAAAKRSGRAAKATLTVDPDVLDDAKNGFWVALSAGRYRTFAQYVTDALAAHNEAMRAEYTGGKPFPPRPTGNLPTAPLR